MYHDNIFANTVKMSAKSWPLLFLEDLFFNIIDDEYDDLTKIQTINF